MLNDKTIKEDLDSETGLPYTKKVMTFNSGRLFKGHCGGIQILGNKLLLYNAYYHDNVNQFYDTSEDVTTRMYVVNGNVPNYISNLFHLHSKIMNFTYKFKVDRDTDIFLNEYSIKVERKIKEDKLRFHDHWDNINHLKEMRPYMVKIKQYIKNNPCVLDNICRQNPNDDNLIEVRNIKI